MARAKQYASSSARIAAHRARQKSASIVTNPISSVTPIVTFPLESSTYDTFSPASQNKIINKNNDLQQKVNRDTKSCSVSTTATNGHRCPKMTILHQNSASKITSNDYFSGEVFCDWMSFRHDFSEQDVSRPINSGKTLKITIDGQLEWEKEDFTKIHCVSSDTSIRIKSDGKHLWFQGNVGRFTHPDNLTGLSVYDCFQKAVQIINRMYPHIDTHLFGTNSIYNRLGDVNGTFFTRLDLTANFHTESYHQLSTFYASRKINTRLPVMGKYGPTWGYDTKRGQFWKAKLYDKLAEMLGKRTPNHAETTARFEVQLGSTYLRKYQLDNLSHWGTNMKTENIIYGKFINQLLAEPATAEDWSQFPPKLRQHAVLWRDGTHPKTYLSERQYRRVEKSLRQLGLDISRPCNVMNLVQKTKIIYLRYLPGLRNAA